MYHKNIYLYRNVLELKVRSQWYSVNCWKYVLKPSFNAEDLNEQQL